MKLIDTENLGIEWLSTHPSHDKRQAQLEELLPDALEVRGKASVRKNQVYVTYMFVVMR